MRALCAALFRFHHGLKERAEDGGRHGFPVKPAGFQQQEAHVDVKDGDAEALAEEVTVDVGELLEVVIERRRTLRLDCVEHVEELGRATDPGRFHLAPCGLP